MTGINCVCLFKEMIDNNCVYIYRIFFSQQQLVLKQESYLEITKKKKKDVNSLPNFACAEVYSFTLALF